MRNKKNKKTFVCFKEVRDFNSTRSSRINDKLVFKILTKIWVSNFELYVIFVVMWKKEVGNRTWKAAIALHLLQETKNDEGRRQR